jgi:hypothetical protein
VRWEALVARCREIGMSFGANGAGSSLQTDLLLNLVGEDTSLLLDSTDVSLDFRAHALELLDDGLLDGVAERGVVVGEDLGLVANRVEHLLPSSLTEELMSFMEAASESQGSADYP